MAIPNPKPQTPNPKHPKGQYASALIIILLLSTTALRSQVVYENHQSEVYHFLYRMAQKGELVFRDNIRPLSRNYIGQCLDTLQKNAARLSAIEKKELAFYRQEFNDDHPIPDTLPVAKADFLKKDANGRWRAFSAAGNHFKLGIDPVISASTDQGTGKNITRVSNGFSLYGSAGKHWGFYFSFNDVTEKGTGLDTLRQNGPETGITGRIAANKKSQNFSELRGGISYAWKNGSLSFVQDHLLTGYGENGRIILSDKAPTYPYLRLDYQPLPWLVFNYTHAWLNSNILDSARTYNTGTSTYGGIRQFYIAKFMASHSIQLTLTRGLDLTVGESMVYSDRLNAGYFIPILFFKAYDNLVNNGNINAGSNGQIFLQASSRNQLKNTHLYASLFIDELRVSAIFDKTKSRNQVGITLGGSVTDLFLPYLTLGLEYTRINPFVYRNLLPAQNYTSDDYFLGDWMGNNADRLIYTVKYTPLPRLKCMIRYQTTRKGGPGTLDQQYFQQPQPAFLFDPQNHQKEWFAKISYEWFNRFYLNSYYSSLRFQNDTNGMTRKQHVFSIGMSYGL